MAASQRGAGQGGGEAGQEGGAGQGGGAGQEGGGEDDHDRGGAAR